MFAPVEEAELDMHQLTRDLDRCKSAVFLGKTAAFLGSIMCSLEFVWSREVKTAATNGIKLWWNPDFFMATPQETNKFVLMHELWHVARLHVLRMGPRCPDVWNYACDYIINGLLEDEGYKIELPFPICLDQQYRGMAEEDVYDLLNKDSGNGAPPPPSDMGGDIVPLTSDEKHTVINNVVTAVHQAKMSGAGNLPGDIEELIDQFLSPVIPWQTLLHRFFTQLQNTDYTWSVPDRRFQDIYLPSEYLDDGRLENLRYYLDVSGSISTSDIKRFNSELKFVKETFNPEKLSMVQFDTIIQRVDVWDENDEFEKIHIVGRGGTSLECVRRDILEEKPTAAIIFSDLQCSPMQPLDFNIPVIWTVVGNGKAKVPFGEKIHITG